MLIYRPVEICKRGLCTSKCFSFFNHNFVQDNAELRQQLQSSEREKREQLMRRDVELTRAEETIRREQQQIQEMRQRVSQVWEVMCSVCCD